ncbi:MAG: HmuY family protein [Candidatus Kapabacteria bacterium]|nr:HmuY family protein [Ignavibacteriota bacterium]MCW5883945.1 HmuY family protein [Candidatus Kapabacteria bacterium]
MKNYIIYIIVSGFIITGCFDTELPVKPYPRGDTKVTVVEMSPDYTNQIYFNFEKNLVIKENHRDAWDLAFQCYDEEYFILLNGAKLMEAADMGPVDFSSVTSRSGAEFKYDSTNGDFENYSIGKWWVDGGNEAQSKNHVYIINRGRDIEGKRMGFVKMQLLSANFEGYKIKFAELDGSNESTASIPRNNKYNYIMFSFDYPEQALELEPEKQDWDILFTRYLAFLPFNNSLLPYGVTGVMINHTLTEVTSDSLRPFSDIVLNDIDNYSFSKSPGFIGHEWKDFELNGEIYTAKDYVTYIFKDVNDFYWKFRFIDFYNDDKQRGYPKFEFKKL